MQQSTKLYNFEGTLFNSKKTSAISYASEAKATLIVLFFNAFGEKQCQTFVDPFLKEFKGDENVKILEISVIEQLSKVSVMKVMVPWLKLWMAKDRKVLFSNTGQVYDCEQKNMVGKKTNEYHQYRCWLGSSGR